MTSQLSSARPARRRLPRLPLVVWVAIAAVASFSAGAVYWKAGPGSDSAGTWMKPAAAVAEYRAEARALELAPGWRWPARLAFAPTGPDGAPMRYETGFGSGQASIYWFCSWAATAASGSVSPAARARAVARLDGIHRTPLFTQGLLHDTGYYETLISDARAGKTAGLREYAAANCPAKP